MKLIVDKHEYAQIIRNCNANKDSIGCKNCYKCALYGCCNGESDLENMVTIVDEEKREDNESGSIFE